MSADLRLPRAGDELGGKYRLLRLVGEGGMGVVYEARHLRLKQRVAIKILQPKRNVSRDCERFIREARAASQLESRHVARVYDVDELTNGLPYMVMEFLDGRDLEVELRQRGRLGISESVDYVLQTCNAVAEAHAAGIVHRDLKPSNLFLCDVGGERLVKVLDFGISKMSDEPNVTLTHTALGTPLYMSPEQIRSAKDVDARSDVWALGVILFELLAGRPPFEGVATAVSVAIAVDPPPWPRTLRSDLPEEIERIILKALEKKPENRFQSVSEFVAALREFASDPSSPGTVRVSALPPGWSTVPSPQRFPTPTTLSNGERIDSTWTTNSSEGRRPSLTYALAAAAVVLVGGILAVTLTPTSRSVALGALEPKVVEPAPNTHPSSQREVSRFAPRASVAPSTSAASLPTSPPARSTRRPFEVPNAVLHDAPPVAASKVHSTPAGRAPTPPGTPETPFRL